MCSRQPYPTYKVFLYPHYLTHRSRSAKARAFFSLLSDINECTTNAHNCDVKAFCNNTEGSFNCTCSPGYTGNGIKCTGKLSFLMEKTIDNYNEVRDNPQRDSLFILSYCRSLSTKTRAFFSLHPDINECTSNAHDCDVKAFCNNTEGSFNCTCPAGYTGNHGTSCTGKSPCIIRF